MGKTIAMQPWITLKGSPAYTAVLIQPVEGWVNGENFTEAALNIALAGSLTTSGSTLCSLVIETASAPEGPWSAVATVNAASLQTTMYFTSRASENTDKFERFLRWKLDPSLVTASDWTMTFKICATMK